MGKETNFEADFKYYRELMEDPASRTLSMEYEGLMASDFAAAATDPDSALLDTNDSLVPLCVPLEHMPWYNRPYFRKLAAGELAYYNHLPAVLEADESSYIDAVQSVLGRIAGSGGLLLTDHVERDTPMVDQGINHVAAALGFTATDVLADIIPPARHYLYAKRISLADGQTVEPKAADYAEAFRLAENEGRLAVKKAELRTELDNDEIAHVWHYYDTAFAKLNDVDPILASFTKPELEAMLADPKFLKFIYPGDGPIANVAIVTDIRNCSWMNQAYYRHHLPEDYMSGNVYYSPCIVSDQSSRAGIAAMSMSTMGLLMKGFAATGIEPIMSFVCDEVSDIQVPRMTQLSINRTGVLGADFSEPDDLHVFRAFSFERI